jgi:serine/threonine protein kinase
MCYISLLQFEQVCMLYCGIFLNNTVSSIYTVIWYIRSIGCVADRQGRLFLNDYQLIARLGKGAFGQVIKLKKKATGGRSSNKEFFALKVVSHSLVSEVEKDIRICARGHPFLVYLHSHFKPKVCGSSKLSMFLHEGVSVWRQNQQLRIII